MICRFRFTREARRSEVDRDAFFLPVAKAGRFGTTRATVFDSAFAGSKLDGATFCRFQQGATGSITQRTLAGCVRHILIKAWLFSLFMMVVMIAVVAATGGGGMFGHRVTVLRASI